MTPIDSIRNRHRQGFTLTEILVVIAIVTLLAGLLLSAFTSVRNSARTSSCASNLKQVGLAIAMYANDNRGRYPHNDTFRGVSPESAVCAWADILLPYTRTTEVFVCPASINLPYVPGCPPDADTKDNTYLDEFHFGVTLDGAYDMNVLSVTNFVSEATFKHPSSTVSVLDGRGRMVHPAFQPPVKDQVVVINKPRHNGGNNVLFLDGHVKWLSVDALKDPALYAIGEPTK